VGRYNAIVRTSAEPYLVPYLQAAERFGDGFGSLLWASPKTQRARFEAICRAVSPAGKSVLDVGCGRADYLPFLIERRIYPADYTGIEAVETLATAAKDQLANLSNKAPARILSADFVREPARMFVGADIVMFSGSLNTLDDAEFYVTLRRAFDAAAEAVVFNFLCSPFLAGREWLRWRSTDAVLSFARSLSESAQSNDDYLRGDCTISMRKPEEMHDIALNVQGETSSC
jgi:SAM-dependent methyltransferase